MMRNKIFYPAGSISLILLPILCVWNLNKHKAFEKIGAIEVAYFYHNEQEEYSSTKYFNKSISLRNYIEIEFTGNKQEDNITLENAQIKIAALTKSKDTVNGIHFKFAKNTKYWAFVKAIDICQTEGLTPLMDKNDIWVAYYPPPSYIKQENYNVLFCETNEMRNASIVKAEKLTEFDEYLSKKANYFILLSLIFLLMCFFRFRKTLTERFPRYSYLQK